MTAVSILVPTYNRSDYLKECLDSLLATTVPCEIIVSDNASTDETPAVMATYDDPRLRYVRQPENLGAFGNYNFLMAQASKDYICLFGDDDIALPGCFEKKLAILDNHPAASGVYSPSWVLDTHGGLAPSGKVNGVPDCSLLDGRDEFAHFIINCCLSWQTLVFRRELYTAHGPLRHPDLVASDWEFLIAISKGRHFAFLNEPTIGVRIHDKSVSKQIHRVDGQMVKDMFFIWRKWLLEQDDYPVLTGVSWMTMANMVLSAVQMCWGAGSPFASEYLAKLEALKQEYYDRMNQRFYAKLADWRPGLPDYGADGKPIFRPGLQPLGIDSVKRVLFFHHIDPEASYWRAVIGSYVQTFAISDNVELVLRLDPQPDLTAEDMVERINAHIADLGLNPDTVADMQLIADPLGEQDLVRLYTRADVVVPGGDPRQLDRGARLGKLVMTRHDVEAWRAAAARFLG